MRGSAIDIAIEKREAVTILDDLEEALKWLALDEEDFRALQEFVASASGPGDGA